MLKNCNSYPSGQNYRANNWQKSQYFPREDTSYDFSMTFYFLSDFSLTYRGSSFPEKIGSPRSSLKFFHSPQYKSGRAEKRRKRSQSWKSRGPVILRQKKLLCNITHLTLRATTDRALGRNKRELYN